MSDKYQPEITNIGELRIAISYLDMNSAMREIIRDLVDGAYNFGYADGLDKRSSN